MSFAEHFGTEPEENQSQWQRCPENPIVPFGADWSHEFIAPSTVLVDGDDITLYVEGGADDRECIGRYRSTTNHAFSPAWTPDPHNPILEPSAHGFDRGSVFDPAVIRYRGRTHLYYSATAGGAHAFAESASGSPGDSRPDDECIGLAIENRGMFDRQAAPVLVGRCPNLIEVQGVLTLFYVDVEAGGYRIYAARSEDGIQFEPLIREPVLSVGSPGEWDSFTVTTPKVFVDGDRFAMLYAGDNSRLDDPTGIGLAVSDDLIRWRKHPGNPILVPGVPGTFDSLSVASAVPFRINDTWHIAYAGGAQPVAEGLQSQIGIARLLNSY